MNPPKITHVGMMRGCWPVYTFTNANQAGLWAAEKQSERRIWEVLDIKLGPELMGETVPAQSVLKPAI
jgi:hypothetical protein